MRSSGVHFSSTNSISFWWNYGSMSGLWIVIQVLSSLIIATVLVASENYAFDSVGYMIEVLISGHIIRFVHANFCSIVFFVIIMHLGNGLWNCSGSNSNLWNSGLMILVLVISASFLGYVLPWSHISFWGATVITSLAGVLPYGNEIVVMIWSGFSLGTACLGRFFMLHFLLPILIISVIIVHLIILHEYVSSSAVGNSSSLAFSNWYSKDLITIIGSLGLLLIIIVNWPYIFMDADNWNHADMIVTPEHINPEWYFLFAYCILRCIPDNVFGVLGLVSSLAIISYIGISNSGSIMPSIFILLTWLGSAEVNEVITLASQLVSVSYFLNT